MWGDVTISCVRAPDGRVRYFVGQVIDVSDQVRGTEMLAATLSSMLDPHVILRPVRDDTGAVVDMEYTSANDAAGRYMNRDAHDLIGRRFTELSHGMSVVTVMEWFTEVLDTGAPLSVDDFRLERSDGAVRWLDIRAARVVDSVSFTWRDVTDRHAAVAEIAEREAAYRLLADNATDVIVRSSGRGGIEWVSPSITEMLGWRPDQILGRTVGSLMHPDDYARVMADQKAIIEAGGTEGRVTARFATADGSWRWMSDHGRAILDEDGRLAGGIDSLRDVEAEHRAAEALAEREQRARAAFERAERAERELRGVVDSLIDPWVLLQAVRDPAWQDRGLHLRRRKRRRLPGQPHHPCGPPRLPPAAGPVPRAQHQWAAGRVRRGRRHRRPPGPRRLPVRGPRGRCRVPLRQPCRPGRRRHQLHLARRHRPLPAPTGAGPTPAAHDPLTGLPNRSQLHEPDARAVPAPGPRGPAPAYRGPVLRPRPVQGRQRHPRPRGR